MIYFNQTYRGSKQPYLAIKKKKEQPYFAQNSMIRQELHLSLKPVLVRKTKQSRGPWAFSENGSGMQKDPTRYHALPPRCQSTQRRVERQKPLHLPSFDRRRHERLSRRISRLASSFPGFPLAFFSFFVFIISFLIHFFAYFWAPSLFLLPVFFPKESRRNFVSLKHVSVTGIADLTFLRC